MIRSARGFILPEPKSSKAAVKEARKDWAGFRLENGFVATATKLLSKPTDNMKLGKGSFKIYGLSLAASRASGINVCEFSTPPCVSACVGKNGNGAYPDVVKARIVKTKFLFEEPECFAELLNYELEALLSGYAVRLNTFSDIDWTKSRWIFEKFPHLNFYDYTKDWNRSGLSNYHLTYSASERTLEDEILDFTDMGRNVAVVFDTRKSDPLPLKLLGIPIVDGDKTDERWLDPSGVIVGLRAKGKMRRDKSGFVRT